MNQLDGEYNTIQDKFQRADQELQIVSKVKQQIENDLRDQTLEMQKFQIEYEQQLETWKNDKSEMQRRIHELASHAEKQKYDSQEQLEIFKSKYNDYKTKLKKANLSIQTLTTRLAKQELQIQAEREIGRVDSVRMGGIAGTNFGSDLSAA